MLTHRIRLANRTAKCSAETGWYLAPPDMDATGGARVRLFLRCMKSNVSGPVQ